MKIFAFLISAILANSTASADETLQDKVNKLDIQSKEILGVSIYAASELNNLFMSDHPMEAARAIGGGGASNSDG